MTIEELSTVATDEENFSREGHVVVRDRQGNEHEVKKVKYEVFAQRLIIEI